MSSSVWPVALVQSPPINLSAAVSRAPCVNRDFLCVSGAGAPAHLEDKADAPRATLIY